MDTTGFINSLSDFFTKNSIDHALIGALALHAYGYVRSTRDVDFVVRQRDQRKVTQFVSSLGFATVHESTAFSNHVHPVGALRVDFMFVDETTGDRIFRATCSTSVFGNSTVPVASAEHLIAMKLFSAHSNPDRRLKDLADVKEIVQRCAVQRTVVESLAAKNELTDWVTELYGTDPS